MERQAIFNDQYEEGAQVPYIRRVPRQQNYEEYPNSYSVKNVQDSGVPISQIRSTFNNQYSNYYKQRQLWNQANINRNQFHIVPATGELYKTEPRAYQQHNLRNNIYHPSAVDTTNRKTCQEHNFDSYKIPLIHEKDFNQVNAMNLATAVKNNDGYCHSSLPSKPFDERAAFNKYTNYQPGSKLINDTGISKPYIHNICAKISSSMPKKLDDDVEMKKYEFNELPTKLARLRNANVKAKELQRKINTAFKMVDEQCNDDDSQSKFIDESENIGSNPRTLSTISQSVEKNNYCNGYSDENSSQKLAKKNSEDLDRLEKSRCTILSVIYDGIQKCEKPQTELLSVPKSRDLQKLSQPDVVNSSLDRSVCSMLHSSPQIVSNLVKEIRDHHLENICEEVKRLRNLEDLSQKFSLMNASQ